MRHILILLLFLVPVAGKSEDFAAFKHADTLGFMRHALAPGIGDPANFRVDDCTTQRVLDDKGRAQARRIGVKLRASGVTFDEVWTSQWCRARDTAVLLDVGPVIEVPALNSHFAGRGNRATQTARMVEKIAALPPGRRILMVTHQVNIIALVGSSTASGEIIAARRVSGGQLDIIDRYLIAP